jgi:CHAT domain-containing protein
MLSWLWNHVVKHIFSALADVSLCKCIEIKYSNCLNLQHSVSEGRLWWCPVGAFTGLPLHAAAPTDQFIQSYTSTPGALLESFTRHVINQSINIGVGVTHSQFGSVSALPGVGNEIIKINSITNSKYRTQSLVGEKATVDAVKEQLQNCSWVHLACHGTQNLQDPPKSCLYLYDGTLELEGILKMPLSNAEFVFLAACQTAMGHPELGNESFHLGGGLIAAGFQAAIGTMWSMRDEDGPVAAEIVYQHLFEDGRGPKVIDTARALQLAVRKLWDDGVPYQCWVPFIHMGV